MPCSGECKSAPEVPPVGAGPLSTASGPHSESDSDIWSDQEVPSTNHIKRDHTKQGYVDGLSSAKEESLQKGFDDGYPAGAQLGVRAGRVLAKLIDHPSFETAKKELNITNILKKSYFTADLDLAGSQDHPVLAKWEAVASGATPA